MSTGVKKMATYASKVSAASRSPRSLKLARQRATLCRSDFHSMRTRRPFSGQTKTGRSRSLRPARYRPTAGAPGANPAPSVEGSRAGLGKNGSLYLGRCTVHDGERQRRAPASDFRSWTSVAGYCTGAYIPATARDSKGTNVGGKSSGERGEQDEAESSRQ